MKRKNRGRRMRHRRSGSRQRWIWFLLMGIAGTCVWIFAVLFLYRGSEKEAPDELLAAYMSHICRKEYGEMYEMIDLDQSENISREEFVKRNSAIYEGIEADNLVIEILEYDKERETVRYRTSLDTVAGEITFENEAYFSEGEEGYQLVWNDFLIFPSLTSEDRVRVSVIQAERGKILDRNEKVLAGEGTASSVGIVPGKLVDQESAVEQMGELLELEPDIIRKKLSAKWVKEDSFVSVKTIPKVDEIEYLLPLEPDETIEREKERQERLLEIPGVMISDIKVRSYPLGEAASHLTGYVQNVTAEDLEEHEGEGYTVSSVIGRNGMEGLFEKELKGQNGCRIYIADPEGKEKEELAYKPVEHGQDVRLTIDAVLQTDLYEQFKEDKGCSVAINPCTGEVLALVSTPSYDSNDFILGLSDGKWKMLNEDEKKPLYNRFRQVWCPGSTFKPVIAAIGLECGMIDEEEDYGNAGLSWQKDASWGSYYVTTLHVCDPAVLENALIYSDNIYFAKAALRIGREKLETSLTELGFNGELPFEIRMQKSQYSNTEEIETEIQLADSGYGQGQMLVNPLHMACLYSAFYNEGNVVKPYLCWKPEAKAEYWIPNVFSSRTAALVLEGMKKVVNQPDGTGYAAHLDHPVLAGKTGTAEIKLSKEDASGTELGWFAVFTAEKETEHPILLISMTEDVKGRGGSGYVVERDRDVLKAWFERSAEF